MNISIKKLRSCLFGLLVISFNFGNHFKIAGMSISQCIALIVMLFSVVDLMEIFPNYNKLKKEKRIVLFLILAWGVISIIQVLWVSDMAWWKHGIRTLFINLLICLEMCVLFKDNKDYLIVMKSVELSLLLSIMIGLYENFRGVHFDSDPKDLVYGFLNIRGFIGNSNDFASWIILCLLGVTLYYSKKKRKYVCIIEWLLGAYVVRLTGSRAGVLSVVFGIFFILVGNILKLGEETKNRLPQKRKVLHILGIVSVVAAGGMFLLGSDVIAFINNVSSASSSDVFRLSIIEDSLKVALKYVFIGAGADQTTFYVGINPHNFLLEILADYGILIVGIIVFILWKIFIRIFESKKITGYGIACYAFVPTFLMISIASSSMARLRMTWVVLLLYYFVSAEQVEERKYRRRIVLRTLERSNLEKLQVR